MINEGEASMTDQEIDETEYVFPIGRTLGEVDYLQPHGSFIRQLAIRNGSAIRRVAPQVKVILEKFQSENLTTQEITQWIDGDEDGEQFDLDFLIDKQLVIKSSDIQNNLRYLKFRPIGDCKGVDAEERMSLRTEFTFDLSVSPHAFQFWLNSFEGDGTMESVISKCCDEAVRGGVGTAPYVRAEIISEVERLLLNRAGYLEAADTTELYPEYVRRMMFVADAI